MSWPQWQRALREMSERSRSAKTTNVSASIAIKIYEEEKKVENQPFKSLFRYLCVDNYMQNTITAQKK
jgi:hypothetical protein